MMCELKEFEFIREKLKRIAQLLVVQNYIEASFIVGCLHEICNQNISKFKVRDSE